MNKRPFVLGVMPASHTEKYIGRAIQSVIDRTTEHWEMLIKFSNSS